jgi:hypothetical protein
LKQSQPLKASDYNNSPTSKKSESESSLKRATRGKDDGASKLEDAAVLSKRLKQNEIDADLQARN